MEDMTPAIRLALPVGIRARRGRRLRRPWGLRDEFLDAVSRRNMGWPVVGSQARYVTLRAFNQRGVELRREIVCANEDMRAKPRAFDVPYLRITMVGRSDEHGIAVAGSDKIGRIRING